MGINTASVQRLYVAYFNRPADPIGLEKFEDDLALVTDGVATQAELLVIAEKSFSTSAEFKDMYAGLSNAAIVNKLYENIFGREADPAGLKKFAGDLTDGTHTVGSLALHLSYSAQGTDATVVAARIDAATEFTNGLDTTTEIIGYSGLAAAAEGRAYLAQISGELPTDDATITAEKDAAITNVDTSIAAAVAAGNGIVGKAFLLTTGVDDFTGDAGADTFDASAATLSAGDELDGAGGTDTLTITDNVAGLNVAVPSVTVKNIENVVLTTTGTLGVSAVAGVTGVDAVAQIRQITPTAVTAGSTSTLAVVYGGDTFTTSALDGSATAAEVNALVAAALNVIAGSTIAAIADGRVVVTAPVAGTAIPAITITASTPGDLTTVQADIVANVVGVDAVTAVTAAPYDMSGFTGLLDANVTAAGALNVKAATTADLTAKSTAGKVTAVGGVDQVVTAAGGYAASGATGTIKVTDTAQGAVASTVDNGTTVDITSTSKNAGGTTGTITVGGAASGAPSGAATIKSTISEAKGTTNTAGGAITVTAGGNVDITQTAVKAVQTTALANGTITNAAVTVTGGASTTSVTAAGSAAVTAANTVLAVAGVTEVNTLTFAALTNGQTQIYNGLTFTAGTAGTTAAQTAAAFANLTAGATQGNSTLGVYSGAFSAEGWTSGAAVAGAGTALDTVVFTGTTAGARTNLADNGSGTNATVVVTTAGVDAVTAAGNTGVTANTVSVTDGNAAGTTDTITDVTAHNYTTLGVTSTSLTNLELLGGSGNVTIANALAGNTATTLNLTVDGVTGGTLDDGDVYTTLNVTTKYSGTIVAGTTVTSSTLAQVASTAVDDLNVSGDKVLVLTSTTGMSGLINVDVNGTAGLSATFAQATMKTINTEGTTGTATVTFDATKATYTGGAGVDAVTTSAAAPTKAIDLGAGDDKLTLATGTQSVTGAISGGADSDTLSMTVADVVIADADTAFSTLVTGFEVLELTGGTGAQAVDLSNMGITDKITVAAGAGTLTIADIADNGLLTLTGNRAGDTVALTNTAFATPTDDVMNIAMTATAGFDGGTVTAANVETVNLTLTDTLVTAAAPATEFDVIVTADKATTLNVDGNAPVALVLTGSVLLATLDATNATGAVTATSVSTAAITMKGGSAGDSLTAKTGTNADVLIGNGGADTLTSNAGLTTLTGGDGLDLFIVATASANSGVYTTITDAQSGDRIELFDKGADVYDNTKITLASTADFDDYLNAGVAGYNGTTNGKIRWFQFEGNTYIVQDMSNAATFTDGTDLVLGLTGLVDLSLASLSTDAGGDPVLMVG